MIVTHSLQVTVPLDRVVISCSVRRWSGTLGLKPPHKEWDDSDFSLVLSDEAQRDQELCPRLHSWCMKSWDLNLTPSDFQVQKVSYPPPLLQARPGEFVSSTVKQSGVLTHGHPSLPHHHRSPGTQPLPSPASPPAERTLTLRSVCLWSVCGSLSSLENTG